MSKLKVFSRIVKYLSFAVLFSIALSGCSILPGKKTAVDPDINRIVVWGFESEDAWKPIITDFQKTNKGYTLVYEKQALDSNYENRVTNSILDTRKPDIWEMPNDWIYRHKGKLYPMPDTLKKTINIDTMYIKSIKQSVCFDDQVYALSPSAEPLVIFYNTNMFKNRIKELTKDSQNDAYNQRVSTLLDKPPSTWSDFVEAVKYLTKKTGVNIDQSGTALGTSKVSNSMDILYLLMMQNETKMISENYQLATFNLPALTSTGADDTPGKRALEFYASFTDPASPNYSWNDSLGNEVDAFANQKVAMIFGYSSLENYFLQKYPDLQFSYKKAFVPQVGPESDKVVDFARFTAFGVSVYTKNPAASWNLVSLIANDYNEGLNSYNKVYTSKKASNYDTAVANRTPGNPEKLTLATANSLVKGRYPVEFDNIVKTMINNVNSKTQDSQTALDLAANNITELLRKESW